MVNNNGHTFGSRVTYVDREGKRHNALVTIPWATCLNIVYVGERHGDSYGNELLRETSVPYQEKGMSGNYIEYPVIDVPTAQSIERGEL